MSSREYGHAFLKQVGLIGRVIEAVGVTTCNPKVTPSPRKALGRDLNGSLFDTTFNYTSAINMMFRTNVTIKTRHRIYFEPVYLIHTYPTT